MGWQDRAYNHDEGPLDFGGQSGWRPPPTTLALTIAHVVLFLGLQSVALPDPDTPPWWAFVLAPFGLSPQPWRGLLAVVTTVFVLILLAARIERSDGRGTLLGLYVLGTLAGILGHLLVGVTAPAYAALPIGAIPNGAFAAFAMFGLNRYRDELVSVFGYVKSVAWVIGLFALVMLGFRIIELGSHGFGWLTGTFAGAMIAALPEERLTLAGWLPERRVVRPSIPRETRAREEQDEAERDLDQLLAKVSRDGLDSLTPQERQRLEAASDRLRRGR